MDVANYECRAFDAAPLQGLHVYLYQAANPEEAAHQKFYRKTKTNNNGRWMFKDIPDSQYCVLVVDWARDSLTGNTYMARKKWYSGLGRVRGY